MRAGSGSRCEPSMNRSSPRVLPRRTFVKQACAAPLILESVGAVRPTERPAIAVAVVMEPTGAHLDAYLSSLADCDGIREIAIVDASGETFARAKTLARKFPSL